LTLKGELRTNVPYPLASDSARARRINLRSISSTRIGVALDETVTVSDLSDLISVFSLDVALPYMLHERGPELEHTLPESLSRTSPFLTHPVFHRCHSETEMLRYIKRLESRDLSLATSMIPLGSCTMKLNATTEMEPITWPEFAGIHPYAPAAQTEGYAQLVAELEDWLCCEDWPKPDAFDLVLSHTLLSTNAM
jgi:glycine dehydrogenase